MQRSPNYSRRRLSADERFDLGYVVSANGCWVWQGVLHPHGYGSITVNRRTIRAHRFAYERLVGPIPAGMVVCHRCDNRACVNPEHLWLGTNDENMADMAQKRRAAFGRRQHLAKLDEDKVRQIRAIGSSMKQRDLAKQFGVSQRAVVMILHNITWRHVS